MEVPEPEGGDGGAFFEVDLDPLGAVEQLDEVAFAGFLVAVGDEGEVADDRIGIAAGDFFAFGEQDGAFRDAELGGLAGAWVRFGTFIGLGVPSMSSGGSAVSRDAAGGAAGCGGRGGRSCFGKQRRWFLFFPQEARAETAQRAWKDQF